MNLIKPLGCFLFQEIQLTEKCGIVLRVSNFRKSRLGTAGQLPWIPQHLNLKLMGWKGVLPKIALKNIKFVLVEESTV